MLTIYTTATNQLQALTDRARRLLKDDAGLSEGVTAVLLIVLGVGIVAIIGAILKPWVESKLSGGLG